MRHLIFAICILVVCKTANAQYDPVIDTLAKAARQLRDLKSSDPHRPIFHFVNPDGYGQPFDPNGALFWNGRYHMGYIYQKERNDKWEHLWGHIASTDLLHWQIYPDMLTVVDGDAEKDGIFSGGSFLSREGIPHVSYHGWGANSNMAAYSVDPDLRKWVKSELNPLLSTPVSSDSSASPYTAWDPEIWYDNTEDCYYQISGGNPATLFKSRDLKNWIFLGDFIESDKRLNLDFEDVSCPDFFKVGDKYVLLFISHMRGAQYYIGTFANDRFTVEGHGRMNWPGGTFFAPEQLVDDTGRNIYWGWIIERKPVGQEWKYGWSGILSLPRVFSLSENNEVTIAPAEELRTLRYNHYNHQGIKLTAGTKEILTAKGKSLEITARFEKGSGTFGLKVFASPDGREQTIIKYDTKTEELIVDFKNSSIHAPVLMPDYCIKYYQPSDFVETLVSQQRVPMKLKEGEPLSLQVFIDRSVIEIFANGRKCVTQVVYPQLMDSEQIILFSETGAVDVEDIHVWHMAATNSY
ncbi:glycoside hydrolase family 32 protein [Sphingobacterium faecale]|uniref:beta-fructofuranosidase n=1 Tax=Sphingobacterium faecale TaxID=2803775 RepID=A0ABS1RAT3_9SPHI|nr:glycoside hydrolase family 32 protein [Sphingobacterium faecale]MBL1411460.1 glycoside hydrolase family 32 protein [Sphingobacterium faecale]